MSQGGRFPRDGVELIVQGFEKFLSDLDKAGAKWDSVGQRFQDSGKKVKHATTQADTGLSTFLKSAALGAGQSLGLNTAITALTGGVGALGLAVGSAAIKIGQKLVNALQNAVQATKDLAIESLHLAGTYEEMELTALAVGSAMGLSRKEIEDASKDVQEMGIRADVANRAVAQLARNNLELADATDLVRIAQATGIIMQRDSSEEMDALIHAAISQSTVMLRQRGIFIDNDLALSKYAKTVGKHVDALSMQEKAQARLNEIIIQGQRVLGVYDAAMRSPTKQLRSLTGRELPALKAALGAPFLDAWSTAIGIVRDFVGRLTDAVSEGGTLYPVLVNLGAAASLLADGLKSGYEAVISFIEGMEVDMGEGIISIAESAFGWGVEIIAQFAEGMSKAITVYLTAVMDGIGSLLDFWLGPGSPPRVAPALDKWGLSAMTEYLKGMTSADFDILESIQKPLSKVLEGPAFAQVSKSMAKALAGDDRGAFLDIVSKATGMFGEEVTNLAKKQFKLADATKAVEEAEAQLAAARDRVTSSQKKVNKLTNEYNELLRSGASREVLDAQLKRINAAEEQRNLAADQIATSEEQLKVAKKREDAAKDEASLQQRLLDQLLGINTALIEREKKAPRVGKAKVGPVADILPEPKDFDIASRISLAIEEAKEKLKGRLSELFQPLRDAWAEIQEDLDIVGGAWDRFSEKMGRAWDKLKEEFPFLQTWEDGIVGLKERGIDKLLEVLEEEGLVGAMHKAYSFWVEKFQGMWETWGEKVIDVKDNAIKTLIETLDEEGLLGVLRQIYTFVSEKFQGIWETTGLGGAIEKFKDRWLDKLNEGLDRLVGLFDSIKTKYENFRDTLSGGLPQAAMNVLNLLTGRSPSPLEMGLRGINEAMAELSGVQIPSLSRALIRPSSVALPGPSPSFRGMGETTVNNSFQFGGNTIATGMDVAQFEAMVVRVIRREMGSA